MVAGIPGPALLAAVLVLLSSIPVYAVDNGGEDFRDGSCSDKKLKCDEDALCEQNKDHSRFRCHCPQGYFGDGYLNSYKIGATGCTLEGDPVECRKDDECHTKASCVPLKDTGLYHCHCNTGFTGNGALENGCQDIEDCPGNPCHEHAICKDTPPGSYTCECDSDHNYEGDGYENCERVCYNAQDCGENARCENWKCECDDGFDGDGIICTDINECQNGDHTCPDRSTCDNKQGGYECLCHNGFEYKEEDNLCVPYFATCDEMYQVTGGMPNGRYTLDFDGEGPLPAVEVWCAVKVGFAITEVNPIIPFPLPVASQGQEVPVPYPVPVFPLIGNSDFCSQEVWMKCTGDYDGGRVQWEGADGNRYIGWGGNGYSQNCACGDVGKCPGGCYCGNGRAGEDWGVIIKKSALPVTKVVLPPSSGGGDPGSFFVGKLRCGPQSFDIPRDCHEAKFKYGIKESTPLFIDIDGPSGAPPVLVYCNQEAYDHVGIIELAPDQLEIKKTSSEGQPLGYTLPGPEVTELVEGSVFCSQRVEYRCQTDTMTASGVRVTSRSGEMTYFPGGNNDQPGSCGCGITDSCEAPSVLCNCDIDDGKTRSDFGLIIDKSELPVLSVRSTSDDNAFYIGPLQCSQKQFGIEPNCEKTRQADATQDYSYLIDPDGPKATLSPFTVECQMDEYEGVTVVNNEGGDDLDLTEGQVFNIKYLQSTPEQLDGLKYRSKVCVQQLTFTNCGARGRVNIGGFTYNGGRFLSEQLASNCPGGDCPCDKPLTVSKLKHLPIEELQGSGIRMSVGAFRCKETYPDCESYHNFLVTKGVEGEKLISLDTLTIDSDGAGEGKPYVAHCEHKKQTVIGPPTPSADPEIKIKPNRENPGEVCIKLNYTDAKGMGIGAPQMDALMDSAKKCAQTFKLVCSNAMGTGMVKYKNCAGKEFTSFVSKEVNATCACGATGMCQGGPDLGCNCDSGAARTTDVSWIIANYRLPICEVCMELEDLAGSGAGVPDLRLIKFEVSELRCGKKQGRKASCQKFRQEKRFKNLKKETLQYIWMDTGSRPVIVGCHLTPEPPVGSMIIRPKDPVYIPGEDLDDGEITIIYRGFPITSFRDVTQKSNYCTQDLIFVCPEGIPDLTGLWSGDDRLDSTDYEWRDLSEERINAVCADERLSALCEKCGRPPKRLVVTNKARLPVSMVHSSTAVVVDDVTCAYVEKDCDAILKAGKELSNLLRGGDYLIDPDQAGPLPPFKVLCDFHEGRTGITVVRSDMEWAVGDVGGSGGDEGAEFSFKHTYPTATPEQINSLAQESEFCWQGVRYKCTEAPLASSALVGYNDQSLTSFGTADDSDVTGCACGVLGTCVTSKVKCNCDNKGSMVEQGFVTDKDVLPVTGFEATYEPNGQGSLTVTDVRCAPTPIDIPRDCAQALDWQFRHGIDYTKSGEFLISPDPDNVRPFLVYCDYSIDPKNPVTVIKPDPTEDVPVGEEDPEVPYQGPSVEQIQALVEVSAYCYQPVKVDCRSASFIAAGVKFTTVQGRKLAFWSSGSGKGATCTCGTENDCGGTLSLSAQKLTNCNCDIGDDVWRSDAAILDVKKAGPLRSLLTAGIFDPDNGRLNLTVGDVFCAQEPIEFNECETGFHDCAEEATCIDEPQSYRCECQPGWTGRIARSSYPNLPMANGRQCIDDDECTLSNQCSYNSDCENTPGSYRCLCKPGYRQVDDFTCADINECKENMHNCDVNARCINTDGSYRCRCHKGYRGSGQAGKCRSTGQCACFGDPHCESYDGRWSHYQGLCSYVMAATDCSDNNAESLSGSFLVTTRNWDHDYVGTGQYAWIKEVTVVVYGKIVELGQGSSIRVDGEPQQSYNMMSEDGSTLLLSITVIGTDVEVFTDFGLEVIWDGDSEVTLYTPTSFRGKTCGLCGNFNQNPADDWEVGPACPGLQGQTTTRQALFGNSWTYNIDTCPADCDPAEPEKTCDAPVSLVREECSKLFTTPAFADCVKKMPQTDMEGFNDSCVYDLCHSDNPSNTLCAVGIALGRYCEDLLAGAVEWKTAEMCGDKSCDFVECSEPNSHCVDGECVCLMGFTADCHQCVDIDECAIKEHNCTHLGQRCDNTDGSYECGCLEGFAKSGDYCKNINECDEPEIECPDHAECHDSLGDYKCVCCLGYVMEGDQCIRNTTQDAVYGAPGSECCACKGKPCGDPQPVCGTDGESYANYKAMVVTACKEKRHVEVDYPGPCAESCESSPCDKPFQTCAVKNGTATCSCPSCGGGGSSQQSGPVCASNSKVYPSECDFQAAMCETGNSEASVESSLEPCEGEGDAPVGPWSDWSECDNQCGKGKTRRTREKLGDTDYPLEEETACYTVCEDGPCQSDTCLNPGQVCEVAETKTSTGTGEPVAQCVCPDCGGQPESPVCGLVGNAIKTYLNPCLLQQKACDLIKNYTVLEERACEEKPKDCAAVRNVAKLNNTQGCKSLGSQDVGKCYGGCGPVPSLCCLPVLKDPPEMVTLTYRCPDGSYTREKHEKITACKCVDLPEE